MRATSYLRHVFHTIRANPRQFTAASFLSGASVIFINDNIIEGSSITGSSMSPTLSPQYHTTRSKDRVLWRKWRATQDVKRGEVVHFMNPCKPEALAVKRVIATEGDIVLLDPRRRPGDSQDGRSNEASQRSWDAWNGKATVPKGHVWVEGDNWRASRDSNWYGPISKSLITGRAIAVLWPLRTFWGKPWNGFKSDTLVLEGSKTKDWTKGLPVELTEIANDIRPP